MQNAEALLHAMHEKEFKEGGAPVGQAVSGYILFVSRQLTSWVLYIFLSFFCLIPSQEEATWICTEGRACGIELVQKYRRLQPVLRDVHSHQKSILSEVLWDLQSEARVVKWNRFFGLSKCIEYKILTLQNALAAAYAFVVG